MVGIGVFLNLLIMAYQMHLCERELWLPRDAHTGLTPARFDEIDSARLQLPHHGEPILIDANGNAYYQSPYVSLLNAFYFIGIVSTTTGLGDVAPVTNQGKIFAVMAAFMGQQREGERGTVTGEKGEARAAAIPLGSLPAHSDFSRPCPFVPFLFCRNVVVHLRRRSQSRTRMRTRGCMTGKPIRINPSKS